MILNGSRFTAREMRVRAALGLYDPPSCDSPVEFFYRGHPDAMRVGLGLEPDQRAVATVYGRCRRCAACLRARGRLWTARACSETAVAQRTWFGTLTVAPDHRTRLSYAADLAASRARCEPWSALSTPEQFRYLVDAASADLTLYLKRVRKNSKARLRYLLVSEAHKDGFPHFHVLIHEQEGHVTYRQLSDGWRLGFSQFKLVPAGDVKAAFYVCKYLSKSALTRVRASHRYGHVGMFANVVTERLEEAASAVARVAATGGKSSVRKASKSEVASSDAMMRSPDFSSKE